MDFTQLFLIYVGIGVGLLWLSVKLAKRVDSVFLRAAIYGVVFSVWFSPGVLTGNCGALVVPLWLAFILQPSQYLSNSGELEAVGKMFGFFWGVGCLATLCAVGIRRKFRTGKPAA